MYKPDNDRKWSRPNKQVLKCQPLHVLMASHTHAQSVFQPQSQEDTEVLTTEWDPLKLGLCTLWGPTLLQFAGLSIHQHSKTRTGKKWCRIFRIPRKNQSKTVCGKSCCHIHIADLPSCLQRIEAFQLIQLKQTRCDGQGLLTSCNHYLKNHSPRSVVHFGEMKWYLRCYTRLQSHFPLA